MSRATPLGGAALGRYPLGVPIADIPLAGVIDTRSGNYTMPADYIADIFAWGQGGTGASISGLSAGGGGGAAGYSRLVLSRGTKVTWSAQGPLIGVLGANGNDGTATTVNVNGKIMTAGGGLGGSNVAALRSTATGFQVNRYGGGSSEDGEFGGKKFGGSYLAGNGGGAGGFRDLFPGFTGGDGAADLSGGSGGPQVVPDYGGGGGAQSTGTQYSTWAGAGRVLILLYRI